MFHISCMIAWSIIPKTNMQLLTEFLFEIFTISCSNYVQGCLSDVVAKVLDCKIVVCEFELQSRYYVHFRTKTFEKTMSTFIPSCYGLNSTFTILLQK